MTEEKRKPCLGAIFADLLVGLGATALTGLEFPGDDVWADWTPWEERPIQESIEALPEVTESIDPLLCAPPPAVSPQYSDRDFLIPIVGLGTVFRFRAAAISRMIGVPLADLEGWLTGQSVLVDEDRDKVALLAALYVQLTKHFDGKPLQEFHEWLAAPLAGFGNRSPAQALWEGHVLEVVNYLALWSPRG